MHVITVLLMALPPMQTKSDIFPATGGGPTEMAEKFGVPFLGKIPLDPAMLACCEEGKSFTDTHAGSPAAMAFLAVVEGTVTVVQLACAC
jgi:hypothetical protein